MHRVSLLERVCCTIPSRGEWSDIAGRWRTLGVPLDRPGRLPLVARSKGPVSSVPIGDQSWSKLHFVDKYDAESLAGLSTARWVFRVHDCIFGDTLDSIYGISIATIKVSSVAITQIRRVDRVQLGIVMALEAISGAAAPSSTPLAGRIRHQWPPKSRSPIAPARNRYCRIYCFTKDSASSSSTSYRRPKQTQSRTRWR